jgi:hypothetical protein
MKKIITALALVAAFTSVAHADPSPAEKAAFCAGNAMKLRKIAEAKNVPEIAAYALAQQNRNFAKYGTDPSFGEVAAYAYNKDISVEERLKIGQGCVAKGY